MRTTCKHVGKVVNYGLTNEQNVSLAVAVLRTEEGPSEDQKKGEIVAERIINHLKGVLEGEYSETIGKVVGILRKVSFCGVET